ncbi:MAE_28990/MAE_18760 family HEPN-like nuclease [Zarconia navalis]|uniref:MAE_28990/MAE_18760 family HEPN-like nuclease n=1 Tax=Zarconia navalis TaxID=2992134 RepID=UPI0021F8D53A|nr:MAE_28990/MAE_18760 family HEPN-like nuclease [Zarconia navalis]
MTSLLCQNFNERCREVSKYFIFLKSLEQETTKLCMEDKNGNPKIRNIDPTLEKTLKASGFLLLYNLVESTMRNAIEAIFNDLDNQRVSFDRIKPELQKIVLQNLKKRNSDKVISQITAISLDIIQASFNQEDVFSGNIDGRLIRKTADEYGFSSKTDYAKTRDGIDLLVVKSNRNDLAHGFKSFEEVGRDKTAEELLDIQKKSLHTCDKF